MDDSDEEFIYSDDEDQTALQDSSDTFNHNPLTPAPRRESHKSLPSVNLNNSNYNNLNNLKNFKNNNLGFGFGGNGSGENEYTVLTLNDLVEEQNRIVDDISAILNIPHDQASVLLLHFHWNKEKLLDNYYLDPEATKKAAGALQDPKLAEAFFKTTDKKRKFKCPVLLEDFPVQEMFWMGCQSTGQESAGKSKDIKPPEIKLKELKDEPHLISKLGWRGYLKSKIDEGPTCIFATCPMTSCKCVVSPSNWELILSLNKGSQTEDDEDDYENEIETCGEALQKYERFLVNSFVDINKQIKWCPTPNCNRAIQATGAITTVTCNHCRASFCFKCGHVESHLPLTCNLLAAWLEKCQNESETANWILVNTKTCPKCNVRIEKNQGCNHMTCSKCTYQFCWICGNDWKEHGQNYYNCNKYKQEEGVEISLSKKEKEAKKAKQELEKYLHYYKRFAAHEQSLKFAESQLKKAEEKMAALQATLLSEDVSMESNDAGKPDVEVSEKLYKSSPTSWVDVSFLGNAVKQVIENRKILKYTYALAYYLPNGQEKQLFEHSQSDLESFTEKLSELTEMKESEMNRTDVVNYTRVTNKYLTNLLEACENDGYIMLAEEHQREVEIKRRRERDELLKEAFESEGQQRSTSKTRAAKTKNM